MSVAIVVSGVVVVYAVGLAAYSLWSIWKGPKSEATVSEQWLREHIYDEGHHGR